MSTFTEKLRISIGSGILFAILNTPQIQSFLGNNIFNSNTKCLTDNGIMIQLLVFTIITFITMYRSDLNLLHKITNTTYGSLIFFFVSNPITYRTVSSILGKWIVNDKGCPTIKGALLHTLLYIVILTGVMYFP